MTMISTGIAPSLHFGSASACLTRKSVATVKYEDTEHPEASFSVKRLPLAQKIRFRFLRETHQSGMLYAKNGEPVALLIAQANKTFAIYVGRDVQALLRMFKEKEAQGVDRQSVIQELEATPGLKPLVMEYQDVYI